MTKKNEESKRESTALSIRDGELIAGIANNPGDAFRGLDAEMFPSVWKFRTEGEYIDCTVIGLGPPVIVNDEWDGERPIDTWEVAISADFRVRIMTSAQLDVMMPSLLGKYCRILFEQQKDIGTRRVNVIRAAVFKDQSKAVVLTEEERTNNTLLLERLAQQKEEKIQAAKLRKAERMAAAAAARALAAGAKR